MRKYVAMNKTIEKYENIRLLMLISFGLLAWKTYGSYYEESVNITNSSFSGNWIWEKDSDTASFNLFLSQSGNTIEGSHCSVAMGGGRIDCADEGEFTIHGTISDGVATVNYISSYSSAQGQAELRMLLNGNLAWKVTTKAGGQTYLPNKAILIRQ